MHAYYISAAVFSMYVCIIEYPVNVTNQWISGDIELTYLPYLTLLASHVSVLALRQRFVCFVFEDS